MSITKFCLKCNKTTEPLANENVNICEAYCSDCGTTLDAKYISPIFINQLRFLGKIRTANRDIKGFSSTCQKCKETDKPKLVGDEAFCRICDHKLELTTQFVKLIRDQG